MKVCSYDNVKPSSTDATAIRRWGDVVWWGEKRVEGRGVEGRGSGGKEGGGKGVEGGGWR